MYHPAQQQFRGRICGSRGNEKHAGHPASLNPPAQMGSGMTDGITLPQVPQQYHSEYGSSCRA
ncbi:hypothetical protein KPMX200_320027 [Klebsiella pneumoniae]|nr:hypothetical protein KPMX200_320027 [Klebsiella pneumoniae]